MLPLCSWLHGTPQHTHRLTWSGPHIGMPARCTSGLLSKSTAIQVVHQIPVLYGSIGAIGGEIKRLWTLLKLPDSQLIASSGNSAKAPLSFLFAEWAFSPDYMRWASAYSRKFAARNAWKCARILPRKRLLLHSRPFPHLWQPPSLF